MNNASTFDSRLNTEPPAVSILLPVYNSERYIREAIESVLAQTFDDFELLALDDGSTDASLSILRYYESKDSRIRVISGGDQDLIVALNKLIVLSRGRYLARMDADDVCMKDRLKKQVEFLISEPTCVLVGGMVEQINGAGQPIGILKSPCSHDEIDQAHLKGHTSICHPTAMYRRTAVESAGSYDKTFLFAEDLDLWLRLAEIGKVANLPDVLLRYRLHGSSISEAHRELQQDAMRRVCESAWQRRNISGSYGTFEHWRPGPDKGSRHKFALQYGWVAWKNGHRGTWRTYASEALRLRPFAISSWRLLVFGFLKRPRQEMDR